MATISVLTLPVSTVSPSDTVLGVSNNQVAKFLVNDLLVAADSPVSYAINGVASFSALHSKSYPPAVWILNAAGEVVETDVIHSPGNITLVFAIPFTGILYIR